MNKVNSEMLKALGNLNIEGLDVSNLEYKKIAEILIKYKEKLGPEAIDSLLYALAIGNEIMKEENARKK